MRIIPDEIDKEIYFDVIINIGELDKLERGEMVYAPISYLDQKYYLGVYISKNIPEEEFEKLNEDI